jgi:HNH endonuclease
MKKNCSCGNLVESKGRNNGKQVYSTVCSSCKRNKYVNYQKSNCCNYCKFVPVWLGQLDLDHIDGDHFNNDPSNLQTLCANCHRLKTHLNQDYIS